MGKDAAQDRNPFDYSPEALHDFANRRSGMTRETFLRIQKAREQEEKNGDNQAGA